MKKLINALLLLTAALTLPACGEPTGEDADCESRFVGDGDQVVGGCVFFGEVEAGRPQTLSFTAEAGRTYRLDLDAAGLDIDLRDAAGERIVLTLPTEWRAEEGGLHTLTLATPLEGVEDYSALISLIDFATPGEATAPATVSGPGLRSGCLDAVQAPGPGGEATDRDC